MKIVKVTWLDGQKRVETIGFLLEETDEILRLGFVIPRKEEIPDRLIPKKAIIETEVLKK